VDTLGHDATLDAVLGTDRAIAVGALPPVSVLSHHPLFLGTLSVCARPDIPTPACDAISPPPTKGIPGHRWAGGEQDSSQTASEEEGVLVSHG